MESESILERLNPSQLAAVTNTNRACLVDANVGSGKTTVLISKILYLHTQHGVPYNDMVVLTFTNKAAAEIKERLAKEDIEVSENNMPYFGTFHSVALYMLRNDLDIGSIGFSTDFTVIDPDEESTIAVSLASSNMLEIKYINKLTKRLELARAGKYMYGVMKQTDDIKELYTLLQSEKRRLGKMDFDDLIYYATELLKVSSLRPSWIIIDEFQDTSPEQMRFIDAIVSDKTNLFAVGDPNQIIYTWRGSSANIFKEFSEKYAAAHITLSENYRSSTSILEVAQLFLESKNELKGVRELGNKITVKNHYNPFNEAQYLADRIRELVDQGLHYSDIAIFYRLQRQSKILEDVFTEAGIPFEVSMRKTLKDIPVLNWVMRVLFAATNQNDTESAVLAISNSVYGERLTKRAAREAVSSYWGTLLRSQSPLLDKIRIFQKWCIEHNSVEEIYWFFNFDIYINPTSASYADDRNYILAFLSKIEAYRSFKGLTLFEGVKDFINSSALFGTDILTDDIHLESDSVKLMTLHAAKGLEFSQVFIIGVNFGIIPLRTDKPADEKEEKRLFFVGITRAKDNLELSYYTRPDDPRAVGGNTSYISMLPNNLIEMDVAEQSGTTTLQALRHEIGKESKVAFDDLESDFSRSDVEKEQQPQRKVKHPKYGIGAVISETEDMLTVHFDGYGEKDFMKWFSDLEDINE